MHDLQHAALQRSLQCKRNLHQRNCCFFSFPPSSFDIRLPNDWLTQCSLPSLLNCTVDSISRWNFVMSVTKQLCLHLDIYLGHWTPAAELFTRSKKLKVSWIYETTLTRINKTQTTAITNRTSKIFASTKNHIKILENIVFATFCSGPFAT